MNNNNNNSLDQIISLISIIRLINPNGECYDTCTANALYIQDDFIIIILGISHLKSESLTHGGTSSFQLRIRSAIGNRLQEKSSSKLKCIRAVSARHILYYSFVLQNIIQNAQLWCFLHKEIVNVIKASDWVCGGGVGADRLANLTARVHSTRYTAYARLYRVCRMRAIRNQ